MEFSKVMKIRQSVRGFKNEQISREDLEAVLDAAYLSPVAMGKFEDTKLLVVQDAEKLSRINEEAGKAFGDEKAKPTYGAPTVIYVLQKKDGEDILIGMNAAVIANNMLLAAYERGLGGCYLMGVSQMLYKNDEVNSILGVPEGYRTCAAAAIGIPAAELSERSVDRSKIETLYA